MIPNKAENPPWELFRLGDDAASNSRRGAGSGTSRDSVNDDRCSAIAEDRVIVIAECDIRRDRARVSRTIRAHNK